MIDMTELKELFDEVGYGSLFDKFQVQFYVTNLIDSSEKAEVLRKFLQCYNFDPEESFFFDEFAFHFRIFHNLYLKNMLDESSRFDFFL
jgi:hypothetical protein